MDNKFDTIVLGLGAMGSAATWHLAKRGRRVLGIDQFSPPHAYGSSHGDTRITRQAIGEGLHYSPLSLRSYELWREIEKETGKKILEITGGLIISTVGPNAATVSINHVPNFFQNTINAAKKYGIEHEMLDAAQLRARFPQFKIKDDEAAYYEPGAGFLRPEECVRAQLLLAEKCGATIHRDETVARFAETNGTVSVKTDRGEYVAENLIVSAGPWLNRFLEPEYSKLFQPYRQVLYWFDAKNSIEPFLPGKFPIFIWHVQSEKNGMYGFPAVDGPGGGVKLASELYETTTNPDTIDRAVTESETAAMYEKYVAPYFPGLSGRCVKSVVCTYTVTPDSGFVIDRHPKHPSIILASPCSGHGFKHSAAIGEILSELAIDGKSKLDISPFKIDRFSA